MKNTANNIIGNLVADDYRTAAVFKKYGIDFCCQGNRTVKEACEKKSIDTEKVLADLEAIQQQANDHTPDYNAWSLDRLADHIQTRHHAYVEAAIGVLKPYIDKICKVHGDRHPELFEVQHEFNESAGELTAHMKKEEFILFPYIKKMVKSGTTGNPHFGTAQNPIAMMMKEHDTEGERFRKISTLTDAYIPPADACSTYRVTFALLKEFEEDLHLHIHLENNILFPRSLALEKELSEVINHMDK